MASNMLKGTLCINPNQARLQRITQTPWKCPPEFIMDSNWRVAAGEESTEAVAERHVAPDPRPYAALHEASDDSDSRTPVIPLVPVEEEANLLNNSSAAFLTTAAMSDEQKSLANDALNALNACASHQGEPPVDMTLFMHWLNNSETVRKYLSGQSVPEIKPASRLNEPTHLVTFVSSNPDQQMTFTTSDNCVGENTGVAISKPRDVETLIKDFEASCGSGKPSIAGASFSVAPEIYSSVVTASEETSLIDQDVHVPLPEATLAAMSTLCSSPSGNWKLETKTERIINESAIITDKRMEPRPREGLVSPTVSFSFPETELSELPRASPQPATNRLPFLLHRNPPLPEMYLHPVSGASGPIPIPSTELVTSFGPDPFLRTDLVTLPKVSKQSADDIIHLPSTLIHSTPLMKPLSLSGNTQVVGQGPPTLKPPQKLCNLFNTPRGCPNGASCQYLHSKSDQASLSGVEARCSAKKMKPG